jgi:hypothetical protein
MVSVAASGAARSSQQPPSITAAPNCSNSPPSELLVRFTGRMVVPNTIVDIYFDWPRMDEPIAEGTTEEDGTFDVRAFVTAVNPPNPSGGYTIAARQPRRPNDPPVTSLFRVPCPQATTTTQPRQNPTTTTRPSGTTTTTTPPAPVFTPSLTLDPPMGPPGFVATAVGTGWPPGSVTIGLTAGGVPITATADASGAFTTSVLVLPGTSIGQVGVQGTGAGGATATGVFLVVPHSAEPPIWTR